MLGRGLEDVLSKKASVSVPFWFGHRPHGSGARRGGIGAHVEGTSSSSMTCTRWSGRILCPRCASGFAMKLGQSFTRLLALLRNLVAY